MVADGFYKGAPPRRGLLGASAQRLERHWGLDTFGEIGAFTSALRTNGFTDIKIDEISGRVAASALHGPLLALRCLLQSLAGKRASSAPVAGRPTQSRPARARCSASPGSRFGYFLVSARRRRVLSSAARPREGSVLADG